MEVKPLWGNILVEPVEEKQKSGFVTPKMLQHDCLLARVIDVSTVVTCVEPGDIVIYVKSNGHEFDGKLIIHEADLLGKIKSDEYEKI